MPYKIDFTIRANDKPIFVREVLPCTGQSRQYLLFVHGNTFPSIPDFDLDIANRSYAEFLAEREICCCIFDSRGYGRSYKPQDGEEVSIAQRAADLKTVYDHLVHQRGATRISLFGLSTGCNVIADFLEQLPDREDRIERIIFSGPCYLFNPKTAAIQRRLHLLRTVRKLTGRNRNRYFAFRKRQLEKRLLRGEEQFIDQDACEAFIRNALQPAAFGRKRLKSPVLAFPDADDRFTLWQPMFAVSKLTYPLLILRGERDHYCCEKTAKRLFESVPARRVKLVTLPATNHDMHLYRDPTAVFNEVSSFMQA